MWAWVSLFPLLLITYHEITHTHPFIPIEHEQNSAQKFWNNDICIMGDPIFLEATDYNFYVSNGDDH